MNQIVVKSNAGQLPVSMPAIGYPTANYGNIIYILKLVSYIIITSFILSSSFAQPIVNVLFVGNSITFYNDMPQTLQKMIDEKGLPIKIDQRTAGGYSLYDHTQFIDSSSHTPFRTQDRYASTTVHKILNGHWDIVVLEPIGADCIPKPEMDYNDSALLFLDSVIKANAIKTILFEKYAGTKYPISYCSSQWTDLIGKGQDVVQEKFNQINNKHGADSLIKYLHTKRCSDSFMNSNEEYLEIKMETDKFSAMLHAGTARVGYAYELCKIKYPDIQLYQSLTDTHPSQQGSYLIACVFYKYITKSDFRNISFHAGIDEKEAEQIRTLVDMIPTE